MPSRINFDVDIDIKDRSSLLDLIPHTVASIQNNGESKPHISGVYLQKIPRDLITGISSIDYRSAGDDGFFKIDFLTNHLYRDVECPAHLDRLLNMEPLWEMLQYPEIVRNLYHINSYPELVIAYSPKNIEELAMILALIRPAKKHLQGLPFDEIRDEIWTKPVDGAYYFKKSHSIAFATAIVVQMNLMVEQTLSSSYQMDATSFYSSGD